jgi:Flp pilus assembly protein TadG
MGLFRRFRNDRRGVSAVEFALIGPIMIACYFALAELCGAMLAEQKASHVCSAVGDLISQVSSFSVTNDLPDVFSVTATIMKPLPAAPLSIRITQVYADATTGATTVSWSKPYGTGLPAYSPGQPITIPAGLIAAGQYIIMSEVRYPYTSPVSQMIPNGITFNEVFYLEPRVSDSVTPTP